MQRKKFRPDRRTASSDFSPARRSRHGQNPSSFPPLRTTLVRVVADAIVVPMQIAPVCTRITTLGVCRRGRFAIGVLHLALGRAQCNGDRPILCTDFHDVRIRYCRGSHAAARRRRAPPAHKAPSQPPCRQSCAVWRRPGPRIAQAVPFCAGGAKSRFRSHRSPGLPHLLTAQANASARPCG